MLRNFSFLMLLASCVVSTASFAMDDDLQNIRFEKQAEMKQFIKEYKETGKPISLAVACGAQEMPYKIRQNFKSSALPTENWIGLDLYLNDQDGSRGGPHVRMDVKNAFHWQQFANYLKENDVEVQTVALTIMEPSISSSILHDIILPFVKKGGHVVYPECFPTDLSGKYMVSGIQFGCFSYGNDFEEGLKSFHARNSPWYQNKEKLRVDAEDFVQKNSLTMGGIEKKTFDESEKKLEAKVFVNRVTSFKTEYLNDNGRILIQAVKTSGMSSKTKPLFNKTEAEFAKDYLGWFKEYMMESYPSLNYKIYCSSQEQNGELYGVEDYVYPQDGTFKFTGYGGRPSLVLIK